MTELKSLDDLVKHFPPGDETLLALDIDQTLVRSTEYFGSDPWYDERVGHWQKEGQAERDAILSANDEWERAQEEDSVITVEKNTAKWLKSWQALRHVKVMALTARRPEIASVTFAQLKHVGISFDRNVPFSVPMTLTEEAQYDRGILYVGPLGDKAACLSGFMARLPKRPTGIAFVDDRAGHVTRMAEFAATLGIPCFSARYSGADTAYEKRMVG